MDGSEKIKPMVVYKSETPRCLKNINKSNLKVNYRWNKNAWMTQILFNDWLTIINNKFRNEKRNIFLFVDNFSGHNVEAGKYLNIN